MSGSINFAVYPSSNRTPGVFAEVNNTLANTGQVNQNTLIIGQVLAGSTGFTVGQPVLCQGVGDTQTKAGAGSMLALMAAQYRASDGFGSVWLLPLADDPAAVVGTATVTVTAGPTANGTWSRYLAGQLVPVLVTAGMTAAQVATALVAAIAAAPNLPMTASAAGAVVTLTAKNKGAAAGQLSVTTNFYGSAGGEVTPTGLAWTDTPFAGGSQNPTALATALASCGEQPFDFIVLPYTDTASLLAVEAFLGDVAGRWSWESELFGHAWAAYAGTLSQCSTFGAGNNSQHVSVLGFNGGIEPAWVWAADWTANCAVSVRADPAIPLQYLALGVKAPPIPSRFVRSDRNTLLYDGISTFTVDDSGTVITERVVTTYQTNLAGAPDDSYLDTETMYQLTFGIRGMRTFLQSNFARMVLVIDGTRIAAGSNRVTSQTILAAAIAYYRTLCNDGPMQDPTGFAQAAAAQNAGNGLVKLLLPFRLANQLRQIAMLVQFTKP